MSDIKCPICQNNLHKINIVVSTCTNDKCKLWGSSIPNLVLGALAQAKQDLERTRKALEVAVNALGYYASENSWDETNRWMFVENGFEFAKDVLKQITALEQKD